MGKKTQDDLVQKFLSGDRLALARLISRIENRDASVEPILAELFPKTGRAQVWGITGPPGAGKSTLVDCMIRELRKQGKKVAVTAVDPSSPFSGGAILGDRIRMQTHSGDRGVYIRSVGTRGKHGGVSHATQEVVMALDAAGFDVVLVETAGVGQTELGILRIAHTVLVVLVPESGDSIQVMKAGLMEIADVFAVNKSDRPESDKLVKELILLADIAQVDGKNHSAKGWVTPVHRTEAVKEKGVQELVRSLEAHSKFLIESGMRDQKIRELYQSEVLDILSERVLNHAQSWLSEAPGVRWLEEMIREKTDPYTASRELSSRIEG